MAARGGTPHRPQRRARSTGSAQPVARVAESGHDETTVVQSLVDRCSVDPQIRVRTHDSLDAFGSGDEREEGAGCERVGLDRCDRGANASAGCKHWIEKE